MWKNDLIAAWVTWPDGVRLHVVGTVDELDRLYRQGCDIEVDR